MKTVLVAGGAGYIGSHACKALSRAGYQPVVYDDFSQGHEWAVKWGPFEKGSVLDGERLRQVFRKYSPEAVMHFAGKIAVGESVREPLLYYENNVMGTLQLARAAIEAGTRQFVFSSTAAVYGQSDRPLSEDSALGPSNPYGQSKLSAEHILRDVGALGSLKFVIFRYFNAAGADPDGKLHEAHDPETHLIPLVLRAASGRTREIVVFGTDFPTPDGTCLRDYVHVSDLAAAHVAALGYLSDGGASDVMNLGNQRAYSVKEVIDAAKKVTGREIPVRLGERRDGDPAILIANSERARSRLRWQPQFPELSEIIASAWASEKNPYLTHANDNDK